MAKMKRHSKHVLAMKMRETESSSKSSEDAAVSTRDVRDSAFRIVATTLDWLETRAAG